MTVRRAQFFASLLLSCFMVSLFGQHAHPFPDNSEHVIRVYFENDWKRAQLQSRLEDLWTVNLERRFLVARVDAPTMHRLAAEGYAVVEDATLTARLAGNGESRGLQDTGIPGYPCYATVEETFAAAQAMAEQRPDLAEWIDAGDSWEKLNLAGGYDLMVLRLTNEAVAGPKPALLVLSGLHAREYAPGGLVLDFARRLFRGYGEDADITWLLDHNEIHLMLQANPDGRKRAESGISWRKNANGDACPGGNNMGVDLNRNFPYQWGFTASCSSDHTCSFTYRGIGGASEPETQAVRDYARAIFPDQRADDPMDAAPDDATGVFLDIHSFGRCVLWPFGYDIPSAPNGTALQTLGRKLAWYNGYQPEEASVSFDTCGTTDDFAYGDLGVAAYTFELGFSFFENCLTYETQIRDTNLAALMLAAKSARAPYLLPAGPVVEQVSLSDNTVTAGNPVTVTATVSDDRFNNSFGTEAVQNITGASLYLDLPPWEADRGSALPMDAADGAFNQTTESVTVSLDTTGLASGRYTLFIQADDAAGDAGTVSAAFLYIQDPLQSGRIEGVVRSTEEPTGASISANDTFFTSASAFDGSFGMNLPPGDYTVSWDGVGFAPRSLYDVTVVAGETTTLDLLLLPNCTRDLQFSAVSGSWLQRGGVWLDSPDGYYAPDEDALLLSRPLDLRGARHLYLTVDHDFDLDTPGGDAAQIGYLDAEGRWTALKQFAGFQQRQAVTVDLEEVRDMRDIRLGFRMVSDAAFDGEGWSIYDTRLVGSFPDCAQEALLDGWPAGVSVVDFIEYFWETAVRE
ncbi:MAG: M14 family zinc carboxypeptidase [Acidobacteriota bacterium]|nr:M14 family zinc carboxypeptidase [Acidobacteriota bacterium]